MNTPIAVRIECAKGEILNAMETIQKRHALPPCIMDGVLSSVLAEVRSEAKIELINSTNTMMTEKNEELEKAKKKLEDKENELAAVEKKLEIASDQNMMRFKVKFEDMQAILNDIISIMAELDEEKRGKCKNALRNVIKEYGI